LPAAHDAFEGGGVTREHLGYIMLVFCCAQSFSPD
jgi:hypothetical protein